VTPRKAIPRTDIDVLNIAELRDSPCRCRTVGNRIRKPDLVVTLVAVAQVLRPAK
jgi:hypothetical protein